MTKLEQKTVKKSYTNLFLTLIGLIIAGLFLYLNNALIILKKSIPSPAAQASMMNNLSFLTIAQAKLDNQINQIQTNLITLQKNTHKKSDTWNLCQARYLLQIAQLKLMSSYDIDTATKLYNSALEFLKNEDLFKNITPYTSPASQQTLNDLLTILDKSKALINNLQTPVPSYQPKASHNLNANASNWIKLKKYLEKLIIIQHHKHSIQPLLSIQETKILRENIYLKLQTAEWSLIAKDEELYKSSIQKSINILTTNFTPESADILSNNLHLMQNTTIFNDQEQLQQLINEALNQLNTALAPSEDPTL